MSTSRLEELLDAYFDGHMTAEEKAELQPLLLESPEARRLFWKLAEQHSLISEVLMEESGRDFAIDEAGPVACAAASGKKRRSSTRHQKAVRRSVLRPAGGFKGYHLAAAMAAAALLAVSIFFAGSGPAPDRDVATRSGRSDDVGPAIEEFNPLGGDEPTRDEPAAPGAPAVARTETAADETAPHAPAPAVVPDAHAVAVVEAPEPARTDVLAHDASRPVAATATGAQHQAYVDSFTGGKPWLVSRGARAVTHVAPGHPIRDGDRLRTGQSRMRVMFESGTALYLNKSTSVTFKGGIALYLEHGDVYVETVHEDTGFRVETKYGIAVDLGTRFGVEARSHRTTVVVVQGEVEASTDQGKVKVPADHEALLVIKVGPPNAPVRVADAEGRFDWAKRPKRRVVVVRGPNALTTTEEQIVERLTGARCEVATVLESESELSELSRADLVIVSSTTRSSEIAAQLRTCTAPVICWETWLYPDMGLTKTRQRVDYSYEETGQRLAIRDADHQLAAGLTGIVEVYRTPYKLGWGIPLEGVHVIASVDGKPDEAAVFCVERGTMLGQLTVPAPRVGFFFFDDPVTEGGLTPDGWKLFDAAVKWCLAK